MVAWLDDERSRHTGPFHIVARSTSTCPCTTIVDQLRGNTGPKNPKTSVVAPSHDRLMVQRIQRCLFDICVDEHNVQVAADWADCWHPRG
jgi:hypothetical protein